jgi:hypothetical protein
LALTLPVCIVPSTLYQWHHLTFYGFSSTFKRDRLCRLWICSVTRMGDCDNSGSYKTCNHSSHDAKRILCWCVHIPTASSSSTPFGPHLHLVFHLIFSGNIVGPQMWQEVTSVSILPCGWLGLLSLILILLSSAICTP